MAVAFASVRTLPCSGLARGANVRIGGRFAPLPLLHGHSCLGGEVRVADPALLGDNLACVAWTRQNGTVGAGASPSCRRPDTLSCGGPRGFEGRFFPQILLHPARPRPCIEGIMRHQRSAERARRSDATYEWGRVTGRGAFREHRMTRPVQVILNSRGRVLCETDGRSGWSTHAEQ